MKVVTPEFIDWLDGVAPDEKAVLDKIARAGRVAYRSDRTEGSEQFVRMLISRGHESVLEHASVGVIFTCDRGIQQEITRHRLAAYTIESTRYCNYTGDRFGNEISVVGIEGGIKRDAKMKKVLDEKDYAIIGEWIEAMDDAEMHYNRMIELGASPQIARDVLPLSLSSCLAVTMDIREWRHFFKLRCAPDAHPQMREVAEMLLSKFREVLPVLFEDI